LFLLFYLFLKRERSRLCPNEEEIAAYVAKNKLNAQRSDSGLYYVINEAGKQPLQLQM
jgi:hypothetical protein